MKKFLAIILLIIMALTCFAACTDGNGDNEPETPPEATASNVLIAYFSCTNNTEGIAKHIQAETGGTLYEIVPEVPYTEDDLKYYTDCRADREQADAAARPAISGSVEDIKKYDTIFLGYPIWHGQAPKIIYTFLESYDFTDKTVIPFCTSQSSGIGSSDTNLHPLAPDANWLAGKRFSPNTPQNTVADWIKSLDVKFGDEKENTKMYITVNGNKLEVALEDNSSVTALMEILKKDDLSYSARDYGDFEKVGNIGRTLPSEDTYISTEAGDVVLYEGNQIVIFYGNNAYDYTKLGKINGYTVSELRSLLGAGSGNIQITLSLN